jgi:hypothetical protein
MDIKRFLLEKKILELEFFWNSLLKKILGFENYCSCDQQFGYYWAYFFNNNLSLMNSRKVFSMNVDKSIFYIDRIIWITQKVIDFIQWVENRVKAKAV